MTINNTSLKNYPLIFLFSLFSIYSIHSQEWFNHHSELTNGLFSKENSQPNPNSFLEIIGTTGGTKLKPSDTNYLGKDIIKNIRSFHLMEIDFRHQLVPSQVETQLKPHTCGCDFSLPSCQDTISCDVPEIGAIGDSPFYEWKSRYCAWKKTNGNYKIDEIYASIEAIYTPSPVPVAGVPEDITCHFVKGKNYPNKWYSAEEWGGTPTAIRKNAKKYAASFIASFCPNDESQPCLVDVLEIGSEPWGEDPGKMAYHEICWGIIEAMQETFQTINKSGWRMKLSTGAFSAYNPSPGCSGDSNQYIAEMIPDQQDIYGNNMRDYFSYISVHNYAFNSNNVCFDPKLNEMPESPNSSFLRLKNMKQWAATNMPDAEINLTEFGWNSGTEDGFCNYFIGEANQAAYYMRAYLLAARYGINKAFTYATYDSFVEYIFCSTAIISGKADFDKNDNISSDNRQPKLILSALDRSMRKIRDKHFIKVIEESEKENGTIAYLIGDYNETTKTSTPTHLVAWEAKSLAGTADQNFNFSNDYPRPNDYLTTIQLPSDKMALPSDGKFFYLGWKNSDENEEFLNSPINDVVVLDGLNRNTLHLRLSGLPLVIPINANGCIYDTDGQLINCESENPSSCNNFQIAGGIEQINISGLDGNYAKIEIIGANTDWKIVPVCDGDCSTSKSITGLEAGNYSVKVNFVGKDGVYCYREEEVTVRGDSNNGGNADCSTLVFTGDNGQISVSNLVGNYGKVEIIGANTDWKITPICDGNCTETQLIPNLEAGTYAVKVNFVGNDGVYCYREVVVEVISGGGGNNNEETADCNSLTFAGEAAQIIVDGEYGLISKIEIIGANTGWALQEVCNQNCTFPQVISNLSTGDYTVKVFLSGNDDSNCYREQSVTVGGSSNRISLIEDSPLLFPNPAKNSINLETISFYQKSGDIFIYNTFGQLIKNFKKQKFASNLFTINLNNFENGIYLLVVKIEGKPMKTSRFIVENLK